MGDRRCVGRLPLRPFRVDVNPLPVLRSLSELADTLLSNRKPVGHGDFAADELGQSARRVNDERGHSAYS
jgi:hypothetical protein